MRHGGSLNATPQTCKKTGKPGLTLIIYTLFSNDATLPKEEKEKGGLEKVVEAVSLSSHPAGSLPPFNIRPTVYC